MLLIRFLYSCHEVFLDGKVIATKLSRSGGRRHRGDWLAQTPEALQRFRPAATAGGIVVFLRVGVAYIGAFLTVGCIIVALKLEVVGFRLREIQYLTLNPSTPRLLPSSPSSTKI